jgi:hypothetical protein
VKLTIPRKCGSVHLPSNTYSWHSALLGAGTTLPFVLAQLSGSFCLYEGKNEHKEHLRKGGNCNK